MNYRASSSSVAATLRAAGFTVITLTHHPSPLRKHLFSTLPPQVIKWPHPLTRVATPTHHPAKVAQHHRAAVKAHPQQVDDTQRDAAEGMAGVSQEVCRQSVGDVLTYGQRQGDIRGNMVGTVTSIKDGRHWRSGRSQTWDIT